MPLPSASAMHESGESTNDAIDRHRLSPLALDYHPEERGRTSRQSIYRNFTNPKESPEKSLLIV